MSLIYTYKDILYNQGVTNNQNKAQVTKKTISFGITGQAEWFNVRKGYGFIHRDDWISDIFVHNTVIIKNRFLRFLAQGDK